MAKSLCEKVINPLVIGASAPGAIIPYASGTQLATLSSLANGLASTVTVLGFGRSTTIAGVTPIITLGATDNFAFTVPRDGVITSIAADFSTIAGVALLGTVTIKAQLYSNTTPDNDYSIIPGAQVSLAPTLSVVTVAGVSSGIVDGLSIPVAAGTRLLLVFYIEAAGAVGLVNAITGFASAGVTIA